MSMSVAGAAGARESVQDHPDYLNSAYDKAEMKEFIA